MRARRTRAENERACPVYLLVAVLTQRLYSGHV